MNIEDIPSMAETIGRIFGGPPAATSELTAPKTSLYWERSNLIQLHWRNMNRYRNADRLDRNSACSVLANLWRRGETLHGNMLRHRHTPLERTLMAIWPRHDQRTDATAWRIVYAQIGGMRALAMNNGIAAPGNMEQIQDDLTLLCVLAIGRENQTMEAMQKAVGC